MNTYTVRYQLGGDEHTDHLEAENAASAARLVEERHLEDDWFELIEVHLVGDGEDGSPDGDEEPAEQSA